MWDQNLSRKEKKSSTKGRHGEDLKYIPKPGKVGKGFDDIDENKFRFRR